MLAWCSSNTSLNTSIRRSNSRCSSTLSDEGPCEAQYRRRLVSESLLVVAVELMYWTSGRKKELELEEEVVYEKYENGEGEGYDFIYTDTAKSELQGKKRTRRTTADVQKRKLRKKDVMTTTMSTTTFQKEDDDVKNRNKSMDVDIVKVLRNVCRSTFYGADKPQKMAASSNTEICVISQVISHLVRLAVSSYHSDDPSKDRGIGKGTTATNTTTTLSFHGEYDKSIVPDENDRAGEGDGLWWSCMLQPMMELLQKLMDEECQLAIAPQPAVKQRPVFLLVFDGKPRTNPTSMRSHVEIKRNLRQGIRTVLTIGTSVVVAMKNIPFLEDNNVVIERTRVALAGNLSSSASKEYQFESDMLLAVCIGNVVALLEMLVEASSTSTSMRKDVDWPYAAKLTALMITRPCSRSSSLTAVTRRDSRQLPLLLYEMISGVKGSGSVKISTVVITTIAQICHDELFIDLFPLHELFPVDVVVNETSSCFDFPTSFSQIPLILPISAIRILSACFSFSTPTTSMSTSTSTSVSIPMARIRLYNILKDGNCNWKYCEAVTMAAINFKSQQCATGNIERNIHEQIEDDNDMITAILGLASNPYHKDMYEGNALSIIIRCLQRNMNSRSMSASTTTTPTPLTTTMEAARVASAQIFRSLSERLGVALIRTESSKYILYLDWLATAMKGIGDAVSAVRTECATALRVLIPLSSLVGCRSGNSTSTGTRNVVELAQLTKGGRNLYRTFLADTPPLLGDDVEDSKILQQLESLTALKRPSGIGDILRPYQWEGISWLTALRRCGVSALLADEMGLGKTIQALVAIALMELESREENTYENNVTNRRRCLVVCPSALVSHWYSEIQKFFPSNLLRGMKFIIKKKQTNNTKDDSNRFIISAADNNGNETCCDTSEETSFQTSSTATASPSIYGCEVMIISYSQLRSRPVELMSVHWNAVIVDEAHCCGNPFSQLSLVLAEVRSDLRIALSGTPVQNQVQELWSLMRFLMPDYLGDYITFRRDFVLPIEQSFKEKEKEKESLRKMNPTQHMTESTAMTASRFAALDIAAEGLDRLRTLHQQVLPFILRRTKDVVAKDLPPKTTIDKPCPLTAVQRNLYATFQQGLKLSDQTLEKELRNLLESSTGSGSAKKTINAANALQALFYLALLSVHPALVISCQHSAYRRRLLADRSCSGKIIELAKILVEGNVMHHNDCASDFRVEDLYGDEQGKSTVRNEHLMMEEESDSSSEETSGDEDDDEKVVIASIDKREIEYEEEEENEDEQKKKIYGHVEVDINSNSVAMMDRKPSGHRRNKTINIPLRRSSRLSQMESSTSISSNKQPPTRPPPHLSSTISKSARVRSNNDNDNRVRTIHKCLIFAQHLAVLDIIESCVMQRYFPGVAYRRLDGSVPPHRRAEIIDEFNENSDEDSIRVLLLTTASCGLGLNLTGADTVIFIEHSWNPFQDLQATDRVHRIGQNRPVTIYRLLAQSTVEERIMGLQGRKQMVVSEIINDNNAKLMSNTSLQEVEGNEGGHLRSAFMQSLSSQNPQQFNLQNKETDLEWIDYESLNVDAFLQSLGLE
eukprot:gene2030-3947_t